MPVAQNNIDRAAPPGNDTSERSTWYISSLISAMQSITRIVNDQARSELISWEVDCLEEKLRRPNAKSRNRR